MNLPVGEKPQTTAVTGAARIIAEVSLGHLNFETFNLGPNADELIVYNETPFYVAETKTTVYATVGLGQLIIKNEDTTGARIMEPGARAQLSAGTEYCLRATTGVFRVLVHHESPTVAKAVLDLL